MERAGEKKTLKSKSKKEIKHWDSEGAHFESLELRAEGGHGLVGLDVVAVGEVLVHRAPHCYYLMLSLSLEVEWSGPDRSRVEQRRPELSKPTPTPGVSRSKLTSGDR